MTTWTNKSSIENTEWTFDGNDTLTTTWGNKTGNTPAVLYGEADENTAITGTFTSVDVATSLITGGKHHLFDNKPFRFGDTSDFMIEYNSTFDCFSIFVDELIRVPILRITADGHIKAMSVASGDPSGEGAGEGSLAFNQTTNKLYIRTE